MAHPLERYKKVSGDGSNSSLGLEDWNGMLDVVGNLLVQLVQKGADFDAVSATAIGVLLDRINGVLGPAYDQIASITGLGSLFTTTSATPLTVALGPQVFTVAPADRDRFAASAYIAAVSAADARICMTGALQSYDHTTGTLKLLVLSAAEPGAAAADWQISACPPPFAPVTADPGFYDGDAPPYSGIPYVTAAVAASQGGSTPDPGTY